MAKPPTYIGEVTGDNMQVSPEQLLDIVQRDLLERPAKGICIQVIREDPAGGPRITIDHYRARVPYHVEVSVAARNLHNLLQDG